MKLLQSMLGVIAKMLLLLNLGNRCKGLTWINVYVGTEYVAFHNFFYCRVAFFNIFTSFKLSIQFLLGHRELIC